MKTRPFILWALTGLLAAFAIQADEAVPAPDSGLWVAAVVASPQAAPATSLQGTVRAIATPPPPLVVEAVNDELDLQTLGAADATVEVTYPEIAKDHTVGLRWKSNSQTYNAPVQRVSDGARKVTFKIPNATVAKDLGLSPVLTGSVGIGNDPLVISQPRSIRIIRNAPPAQYPAPTLPGAPDNVVDVDALTGDLVVRVHYPDIGAGQTVRVLWRGATSYDTPSHDTVDDSALTFTIPKATVAATVGVAVSLSYEVIRNGQPAQSSAPASVRVMSKALSTAPKISLLQGGLLDLAFVQSKDVRVTYTYPGIAKGDTVGIRWAGKPVYETPHPPIGDTPRPVRFDIPYDKVRDAKGTLVTVTATVGRPGLPLETSQELKFIVLDSRTPGEIVIEDLNNRFNDTRSTCLNNQPSYYCNGVTTRGTDNGNFDPWDPSATQFRKGSISFSHIRKDSRVTYLWRNSGYVLLSQAEAIKQNKQQEYLCVFPHDGATDLGRLAYGCGFAGKAGRASDTGEKLMQIAIEHPELPALLRNNEQLADRLANGKDASDLLQKDPAFAALIRKVPNLGMLLSHSLDEVQASNQFSINVADQSTCAGQNATTLNTWLAYTNRLTHRLQQCSLSAQNPAQFSLSLLARGSSVPAAVFSTWNEVLIKVWPAGMASRVPLQAFYYQSAAGLPEARAYQQKYKTRTSLWVPVIKLDATKMAAGVAPFSYIPADQAVQP